MKIGDRVKRDSRKLKGTIVKSCIVLGCTLCQVRWDGENEDRWHFKSLLTLVEFEELDVLLDI
jgi:hypothetical protein